MKGQRKCGKNCEHGLSTEQQEYWENYQWEVYDIRTPEEWNTSIQTDTIASISVYSVIDNLEPGFREMVSGTIWMKPTVIGLIIRVHR